LIRLIPFLFCYTVLVAQDPREIILRSAEFEARDLERIRNYTFLQHLEQRKLDSSGKPAKIEQKTEEVLILYGRPYERLVAKDGKPLSEKEAQQEQKKFDKEMEKRSRESEKDRAGRLAKEQKELAEAREFRKEVADAYTFQLLGEETVDGHPVWVIQADPRAGFKPRSREGKLLPKMRGKLWVTKQDYRWARIEAEVVDTVSFGWMIARLYPETRLTFEAIKVNDEIWMPGHAYVRANGRVALVKKLNMEMEARWDNYRKFQTESRVIAATEVQ
jgi:hypothetical protein